MHAKQGKEENDLATRGDEENEDKFNRREAKVVQRIWSAFIPYHSDKNDSLQL